MAVMSLLLTSCPENREKAPETPAPPTPPTGGSPPATPQSQGHILLSKEEREKATPVELNSTLKETLAEGESKVFRFEWTGTGSLELAVLSNELEVRQDYQPGMKGYAIFDSAGQRVGADTPAINDWPPRKLEPGTYYIKLVGPGTLDIKLH